MPTALTDEQVREYLARLGMDERPEPTKENLDRLIYAHQTRIPFETVAIHRGDGAPDLSVDAIFDKAIARKRGGYCFELNKLFHELLAALGYDVRAALCRVVRGRDGRMPINHRGILVSLPDGVYSADVGFGGPMPAGALRLAPGEEQVICGETFIASPLDDTWWAIERITRAGADAFDDDIPERRQTEMELCTAAVEDIDFDALNIACSLPGVLFRDHELVNLRIDGGYYGLRDNVLTLKKGKDKTVIECEDRTAVNEALLEHFGMDYR